MVVQKRILIIEDDLSILRLYRLELEKSGFSVEEAHDGKVGLTKALHGSFDLIVLDLMLPVMNGFDVLQKIRETELTRDTPVVVLSNLVGREVDDLRSLGLSDSILKATVTPEEFVARMKKVLGLEV